MNFAENTRPDMLREYGMPVLAATLFGIGCWWLGAHVGNRDTLFAHVPANASLYVHAASPAAAERLLAAFPDAPRGIHPAEAALVLTTEGQPMGGQNRTFLVAWSGLGGPSPDERGALSEATRLNSRTFSIGYQFQEPTPDEKSLQIDIVTALASARQLTPFQGTADFRGLQQLRCQENECFALDSLSEQGSGVFALWLNQRGFRMEFAPLGESSSAGAFRPWGKISLRGAPSPKLETGDDPLTVVDSALALHNTGMNPYDLLFGSQNFAHLQPDPLANSAESTETAALRNMLGTATSVVISSPNTAKNDRQDLLAFIPNISLQDAQDTLSRYIQVSWPKRYPIQLPDNSTAAELRRSREPVYYTTAPGHEDSGVVQLGDESSILIKTWGEGVIFTSLPQLMNRARVDSSQLSGDCPDVGTKWISMDVHQQDIHNVIPLELAKATYSRLIMSELVDKKVIFCGYRD